MSPSTEPTMNSANASSPEQTPRSRLFSAIGWTSLTFAILQSVCTVLIGLGGARLLISVLSLAAASSVFARMDALHRDGLRIPMMIFACVGAILNLIVVAQIRRLRNRPSARWRINLSSQPTKLRQERWQIAMSIATLALLVCEEIFHHFHVHRW
jgi:hypothetical protein